MSLLTIHHIKVAVDGHDSNGLLVLDDRVLVAVLACLDEIFYDCDRGRWHLESGFGRCATHADTFATLDAALRWIATRLQLDIETAIAPALTQFSANP